MADKARQDNRERSIPIDRRVGAFRRLFAYISGDNQARTKIEMTAPVVQELSSEKIAMTAPVVQQSDDSGWSVAFVVPAAYSWDTAPEPTDPRVALRLVPERLVVAVRFSGTWGEERFSGHEGELRQRLAEHGLRPVARRAGVFGAGQTACLAGRERWQVPAERAGRIAPGSGVSQCLLGHRPGF